MWKAMKKKLKNSWQNWHNPANSTFAGSVLISVLVFSCRESTPPGLQLTTQIHFTDTTYIAPVPPPQPRCVLIEEFTGVQCANCIYGHEALRNIVSTYGERVVVVSYHTGIFATPLPESKFDFRTPEAEQITQVIGTPPGYPVAVIDRCDPEGDGSLMELNSSEWMALTSARLDSPTLVNIDLKALPTDGDTHLIKVEAHFLHELPWQIYLSVALVQDSITDAQLTPSGTNTSYLHRWTFRKMLTAVGGDLFFAFPEKGRFVRRVYRTATTNAFIPASPSAKRVCAWLHLAGAPMAERWVLTCACATLP